MRSGKVWGATRNMGGGWRPDGTFFAPTRVALPSRGSHHAYYTLVCVMIPRMSCRRQKWRRAAPSRCPRFSRKMLPRRATSVSSFHTRDPRFIQGQCDIQLHVFTMMRAARLRLRLLESISAFINSTSRSNNPTQLTGNLRELSGQAAVRPAVQVHEVGRTKTPVRQATSHTGGHTLHSNIAWSCSCFFRIRCVFLLFSLSACRCCVLSIR